MNIIEAIKRSAKGEHIMCCETNEWLIVSSGSLRIRSSRGLAHLTIKEILSDKWICESDLLTLSKTQIAEALASAKSGKGEEDFWRIIDAANAINQTRK